MSLMQRHSDAISELQLRVAQLVAVSDQLVGVNAQLTERVTVLETSATSAGVSARVAPAAASAKSGAVRS